MSCDIRVIPEKAIKCKQSSLLRLGTVFAHNLQSKERHVIRPKVNGMARSVKGGKGGVIMNKCYAPKWPGPSPILLGFRPQYFL